MAYEMIRVNDRVRVGQRRNGDIDIEVWSPDFNSKDADVEQIFVPKDDAREMAIQILKMV